MKTTSIFAFILTIASTTIGWAEGPTLDWALQFGSSDNEFADDVLLDGIDGLYICGGTYGNLGGVHNSGGCNGFLMKFDHEGNRRWTGVLESSAASILELAIDGNHNVYGAGRAGGILEGASIGSGVLLSKFDIEGNKQWAKVVGHRLYGGMDIDDTGNVYIAGSTTAAFDGQPTYGSFDISLSKYDEEGNTLWTRIEGTSRYERCFDMAVDGNGGVYLTGFTSGDLGGQTNAGENDAFLVKYDAQGNKLWTRLSGGIRDDIGYKIALDSFGGLILMGETRIPHESIPNYDIKKSTLTKFDCDGHEQWSVFVPKHCKDLAVDEAGEIYISGYTYDDLDGNDNAGIADAYLAKYDIDGNKIWTVLHGNETLDRGNGIAVDNMGGVYITGSTNGYNDGTAGPGGGEIFLAKFTDPTFVPEPSSMVLLCLGAFALLGFGRSRRK